MNRLALALWLGAASCRGEAPPVVAPTRSIARSAPSLAIASGASGVFAYALRDPFDLGVSAGESPSLARDLARRQSGAFAPVTWSRLGGVWFMAPVPDDRASHLSRATGGDGDALVLHGNTAVRLDHAFAPAPRGITVRARLDPVIGDATGQSWSSLILTSDPETCGWVANRDATPARVWLVFGAHFHSGDRQESAVDDVEVLDAADGEAR